RQEPNRWPRVGPPRADASGLDAQDEVTEAGGPLAMPEATRRPARSAATDELARLFPQRQRRERPLPRRSAEDLVRVAEQAARLAAAVAPDLAEAADPQLALTTQRLARPVVDRFEVLAPAGEGDGKALVPAAHPQASPLLTEGRTAGGLGPSPARDRHC